MPLEVRTVRVQGPSGGAAGATVQAVRATATATARPPAVSAGGAITHGSQLTQGMVGPRIALSTVSGSVSASDYGTSGVTISGKHFTGTFTPDVACTLVDCRFNQPVDNQANVTVQLNWCTVSPTSVGDWCIGPQNVGAYRCLLEGCSDGIRWSGGDIIECYVRTRLQSAVDHNDGLQAYQAGSGGSLLRNNIDCRPINSSGVQDTSNGTTTGAIFIADNSEGTATIRDNYLAGGNGVLRLHENMFYRVTGNVIVKDSWSSSTGPVSTGSSRPGAFLEWADNTLTDGTVLTT